MHKTYIALAEPDNVVVSPVNMPFGSLLEELELAETNGRAPKLRLGTTLVFT